MFHYFLDAHCMLILQEPTNKHSVNIWLYNFTTTAVRMHMHNLCTHIFEWRLITKSLIKSWFDNTQLDYNVKWLSFLPALKFNSSLLFLIEPTTTNVCNWFSIFSVWNQKLEHKYICHRCFGSNHIYCGLNLFKLIIYQYLKKKQSVDS